MAKIGGVVKNPKVVGGLVGVGLLGGGIGLGVEQAKKAEELKKAEQLKSGEQPLKSGEQPGSSSGSNPSDGSNRGGNPTSGGEDSSSSIAYATQTIVRIFFSVVLMLAGVAILFYLYSLYRKSRRGTIKNTNRRRNANNNNNNNRGTV